MSVEKKELEETYGDLVSFYSLADELLDTLDEEKDADAAGAKLDEIEPLFEKVEKATDVLVKEYRSFASGKSVDSESKALVEAALKDIFDVLRLFDNKSM